jgi:hypothetical protein
MILIVKNAGNQVWNAAATLDDYGEAVAGFTADPDTYGPLTEDDFTPLWVPDERGTRDLQTIRDALVSSPAKRIELMNLTINHIAKNTNHFIADDFVYEAGQTRQDWLDARAELFALRAYAGNSWPTFPTFPDGKLHL